MSVSKITARDIASHKSPPAAVSGVSIGGYLIERLQDLGVRDIFGIPGDYVLAFYAQLEKSPLRTIGCTREDCAGFAADAYARLNGIGAVCVTYCVGGLSLCNSIAGAYAEKSPVVVISGSPGLNERFNNPLLHHRVKNFQTQSNVFRRLCVSSAVLEDPYIAFREIDRVLDAVLRYRRPGYIELPRDMIDVIPEGEYIPKTVKPTSDKNALREALNEAVRLISASQRPVILAGVEVHRFGLQKQLLELAEAANIPIATTMLGKSVISETHPLFVGVYEGAMGQEEVTEFVEKSDCILMLGTFLTDINLGIYTANLDPSKCIYATSEKLRISHHEYHGVLFGDFMSELVAAKLKGPEQTLPSRETETAVPAIESDAPITISRVIAILNNELDDSTIVIADAGDALFSSVELSIHQQAEFLGPAYYASMGFSVPAALGAMAAKPDLRSVVLVGDGAFQMTGMELSTIVRHGYHPIVIVLDNEGYGTERLLHRGNYTFNEIHSWNFAKLPTVLGHGTGYEVATEGQFADALRTAWEDRETMSIIQVHLDRNDSSKPLARLAERLRNKV
ncbi:MAG: alpha-keto acid decarboxylase family protein [Pirellulales bacterium]|nr:alpha-keto acid decarboxylase family protein [Pirellulales bacterium]